MRSASEKEKKKDWGRGVLQCCKSSVQSHQQPCSLGFTDHDDDNDDTCDDWEGEYDPEDENENHNDDEDEKINDDSQRVIVVLIHNQLKSSMRMLKKWAEVALG